MRHIDRYEAMLVQYSSILSDTNLDSQPHQRIISKELMKKRGCQKIRKHLKSEISEILIKPLGVKRESQHFDMIFQPEYKMAFSSIPMLLMLVLMLRPSFSLKNDLLLKSRTTTVNRVRNHLEYVTLKKDFSMKKQIRYLLKQSSKMDFLILSQVNSARCLYLL